MSRGTINLMGGGRLELSSPCCTVVSGSLNCHPQALSALRKPCPQYLLISSLRTIISSSSEQCNEKLVEGR